MARHHRTALPALVLALGLVVVSCGSSSGDVGADAGTTVSSSPVAGSTSSADDPSATSEAAEDTTEDPGELVGRWVVVGVPEQRHVTIECAGSACVAAEAPDGATYDLVRSGDTFDGVYPFAFEGCSLDVPVSFVLGADGVLTMSRANVDPLACALGGTDVAISAEPTDLTAEEWTASL